MPTLLILAAGIGSRYGGLKQIEPVGPHKQTILDYSIYDAIRAGFEKVVFVIRKEIEAAFRDYADGKYERHIPCAYIFQELSDMPAGYPVPSNREKPWGTSHAVLICESVINEPFSVINADDFYGRRAYLRMSQFLKRPEPGLAKPNYAMVGFLLQNTLSDHGSVSRGICEIDDEYHLVSVTERTKIEKRQDEIRYIDENGVWHPLEGNASVSMNYWGFTPSIFPHLRKLFRAFLDNNINNPNVEFYLPTAIDKLISTNRVVVSVLSSSDHWVGITNPEDRAKVSNYLEKLVREGIYPEVLW